MKPTPEQIKQIAIECGFAPLTVTGRMRSLLATDTELQAFFTRAYELGWKNRGESDVETCKAVIEQRKASGRNLGFNAMHDCIDAIRNNTGE